MPRSNKNVKEGFQHKYWRSYFGVDSKGLPLFLSKTGKNSVHLDPSTRFYLDVTDFDKSTGTGAKVKAEPMLERNRVTVGYLAARANAGAAFNDAVKVLGTEVLKYHPRMDDKDRDLVNMTDYKNRFKELAAAKKPKSRRSRKSVARSSRSASRSRSPSARSRSSSRSSGSRTPRARSSASRSRSPSRSSGSRGPSRSSRTPRSRSSSTSSDDTVIVATTSGGASMVLEESSPPPRRAPAKRAPAKKRAAPKKRASPKRTATKKSTPRSRAAPKKSAAKRRASLSRSSSSSSSSGSSFSNLGVPGQRARMLAEQAYEDLTGELV